MENTKQVIVSADDDYIPIPIEQITEPLKIMLYGSNLRVMYEALAITGCRIEELKRWFWSNILKIRDKYFIIFKLGKNQKEHRKVELPETYITELKYYKQNSLTKGDQVFYIKAGSFRRQFNTLIRPKLNEKWNELCMYKSGGVVKLRYILGLKGLRKSYQTLKFVNLFDKYKDATIAMEFTGADMKYKTHHISSYHYIKNVEDMQVFSKINPSHILDTNQRSLLEF